MKINDVGRLNSIQKYKSSQVSPAQEHRKKKAIDEVKISSEAMELLGNVQSAESASRAGKLHELKQAVSTGTYYVDAGKLAEKLLPYLKD